VLVSSRQAKETNAPSLEAAVDRSIMTLPNFVKATFFGCDSAYKPLLFTHTSGCDLVICCYVDVAYFFSSLAGKSLG